MSDGKANVEIGAKASSELNAQLAAVKERILTRLVAMERSLKIGIGVKWGETTSEEFGAIAERMKRRIAVIQRSAKIEVSPKLLDATFNNQTDALRNRIRKLDGTRATIKVDADIGTAFAKIQAAQRAAGASGGSAAPGDGKSLQQQLFLDKVRQNSAKLEARQFDQNVRNQLNLDRIRENSSRIEAAALDRSLKGQYLLDKVKANSLKTERDIFNESVKNRAFLDKVRANSDALNEPVLGPGRDELTLVRQRLGEQQRAIVEARRAEGLSRRSFLADNPTLGPGRDELRLVQQRAAALRAIESRPILGPGRAELFDVQQNKGIRAFLKNLEDVEVKGAPHLTRFQRHVALWTTGIVAGFGVAGAAIGGFAVKASAEIEQTRIAFAGVLGNNQDANALVGRLQDFAAKTPFEFTELTGATQKLLASFQGLEGVKDVLGVDLFGALGAIGDLAATLGRPAVAVDRFILALTQMQGKGRIAAEEVRQMAEAFPGFNVYAAIAKERGISVGQAMQDLRDKVIPFDEAMKNLVAGMQNFNGAAGAMERQSQTLAGRLSTVKDQIAIISVDAFAPLSESVRAFLEDFAISLSGGPVRSALEELGATLSSAFDTLAPSVLPLLESLLKTIGTLSLSLASALQPVFLQLADTLPVLGELFGRLAEAMGQSLAQSLLALTPLLAGLSAAINAIPLPVLTFFVTALGALLIAERLAGPLLKLAGGFLNAGKAVGGMGQAIAGLVTAIRTGTVTMATMTPVLAGIAVAVGLVVTAYAAWSSAQVDVDAQVREVAASIDVETQAILGNADAIERYRRAAAGQFTEDTFSEGLVAASDDADRLKQSLGALGFSTKDLTGLLRRIRSEGYGPLLKETGRFNNLSEDQLQNYALAVRAGSVYQQSLDNSAGKVQKLTAEQQRLVDAFRGIEATLPNEDLQRLADAEINNLIASGQLTEGYLRMTEVQSGFTREGGQSYELLSRLEDQMIAFGGSLPIDALVDASQGQDLFNKRLQETKGIDLSDIIGTIEGLDNALSNTAESAGVLDAAMDFLRGGKLDVTEALIKLGDLKRGFDEAFDGVKGSRKLIDIFSEDGSAAISALKERFAAASAIASARLAGGEDVGLTQAELEANQNQIILDVAAFMKVDPLELTQQLTDLGLVVPVDLTIDLARKQSFVDDIEALKANPELSRFEVAVQTLVDEKKYDEAQTVLDILNSDRFVSLDADPEKLNAFLLALQEGDIAKAIRILAEATSYDLVVEDRQKRDLSKSISMDANTTLYDEDVRLISELKFPTKFVPIDADTSAAELKLNNLLSRFTIGGLFSFGGASSPAPSSSRLPGSGGRVPTMSLAGLSGPLDGFGSRFGRLNSLMGLPSTIEFRRGGFVAERLAGMRPRYRSGAHTAHGPLYAWGEPGTRGEAFVSGDPRFRRENIDVLRRIAPTLGLDVAPRGVSDTFARSPRTSGQGAVVGQLARRIDSIDRKMERMIDAAVSMPPITVVDNSGNPEMQGSKVYWAHRDRTVEFVGI